MDAISVGVGRLLSGGVVERLVPVTDVRFSRRVNGAGGLSANIPLHDPLADWMLDPRATASAIHVFSGPVVLWSGLLAGVQAGPDGLRLGALELWEHFRHVLNPGVEDGYTDTDQVSIADALVALAQGTDPDNDLGVVAANALSGVLRDRAELEFWRFQTVGDLVEEMAAVVDGFEFTIEHDWVGGLVNGRIGHTFRTATPRLGSQTGVQLEVGRNVEDWQLDIDLRGFARRTVAFGTDQGVDTSTGETKTTYRQAKDESLAGLFPRWDKATSYPQVESDVAMQGHASADLARSRVPASKVQVTVQSGSPGVPDTFGLGDELTFVGRDGWLNYEGRCRVMAVDSVVAADRVSLTHTLDLANVEAMP